MNGIGAYGGRIAISNTLVEGTIDTGTATGDDYNGSGLAESLLGSGVGAKVEVEGKTVTIARIARSSPSTMPSSL